MFSRLLEYVTRSCPPGQGVYSLAVGFLLVQRDICSRTNVLLWQTCAGGRLVPHKCPFRDFITYRDFLTIGDYITLRDVITLRDIITYGLL